MDHYRSRPVGHHNAVARGVLREGIIEIVHAFGVRRWGGLFSPVGGVLGVLVGLLVVSHPLAATPIIA